MKFLLDHLESQALGAQSAYRLSALQRAYGCQCSRAVFFGNTQCLSCKTPLGFEPRLGQVHSLRPGTAANTWELFAPSTSSANEQFGAPSRQQYKRCQNLHTSAACSWLIPVTDASPFCTACRLNRTIPNLSVPGNAILWNRLEDAKRRVIAALIALGLPVQSRVSEDPVSGLAFDLLSSPPNGPRVLTGHNNGVITINVEEADPVKREQIRTSMHEPYRTLVGHFRHEVGHYYWDRLIAKTSWKAEFRSLFGNEESDYAAALRANYQRGPRPDWQRHFVSAYASVHPWEDWAETWAHYLHMVDTLGTALSFGVKPEDMAMPFEPYSADVLYVRGAGDDERFLAFVNSWIKLAAVMNELCRSMGQPDFYPFALPKSAITKLHFIHTVVSEASETRRSRTTQAA